MKKGFIYLFLLVFTAVAFTACSDDDDNIPLKDVSKSYSGTALALKFNGTSVDNATAEIATNESGTATITLKNVVLGYPSLEVSNVACDSKSDSVYFTGNVSNTIYEVTVKGTATKNFSNLTVQQKYVAPIVGKWTIAKDIVDPFYDPEDPDYTPDPAYLDTIPSLYLKVENPTDSVVFMGEKYQNDVFVGAIKQLIGMVAGSMLNLEVNYFESTPTGGIAFSVELPEESEEPAAVAMNYNFQGKMLKLPKTRTHIQSRSTFEFPGALGENIVRYYIIDNKFYLAVNKSAIDMLLQGKSLEEMVKQYLGPNVTLAQLGIQETQGYLTLPVCYKVEGGKATVYVTNEMMVPVVKILVEVVNNLTTLGDPMMDAFLLPILKMIAPEFQTMIEESTTFDLGLNLDPYKE